MNQKNNLIILFCAMLIIWFFIAKFANSFFIPDPLETANAMLRLFSKIWTATIATGARIGIAFGIAIIGGIPLGIIFGKNKSLYEAIEPLIDFFRSIPATALFPLFMIFFGIESGSKIAVAAFGGLLIVLFNTAQGVMHASKWRTIAAKITGASNVQIFKNITIWESLPQTFVGIRIAASMIVAIIIVTEMFIGTNVGIGRMIVDAQITFDISGMYAILFVAGSLGYILNYTLSLIEKKIVYWV